MFKRVMLLLSSVMLMLAATGCLIGIKENRETVFVSPVPIPESAKGAVMVATDKKIPLAIVNRKDYRFEQDVGGYVLVDPWFYDLLLEAYKQQSMLMEVAPGKPKTPEGEVH